MNQNTSFSVKRFIFSSLGYFVIFSAIIAMFYLVDPRMLAYPFLLISSAIVAVVLGFYHARYKNQAEVDDAVDTDISYIEEKIEEEIKEVEEKLHL